MTERMRDLRPLAPSALALLCWEAVLHLPLPETKSEKTVSMPSNRRTQIYTFSPGFTAFSTAPITCSGTVAIFARA
eukprot:753386-Hanusia_phi.AAC.6